MPEILSVTTKDSLATIGGADFFFYDPDAIPPAQRVVVSPTDDITNGAALVPDIIAWSEQKILVDYTFVEALGVDTYWFVRDKNGLENPVGFLLPVGGGGCTVEAAAPFSVADLAGQVHDAVPGVDITQAELAVDVEMRGLFQEHTWSFARRGLVLSTVKAKSAGTVSITEGSKSLVGVGTAFTLDDIGKEVRLPDGYAYEIGGVNIPAQTLTLCVAYAGTTVAGASYLLFQRHYALPAGIERILTMGNQITAVREKSIIDLNVSDPRRLITGMPLAYVTINESTAGLRMIELWPVPLVVYQLPYVGLKQREGNDGETVLPSISTLLLDLACARACRIAFGRMGGKEPYWRILGLDYQGSAQQRLLQVKKMDRKRFGVSERLAGSLAYEFQDDPGVDIGAYDGDF